MTNFLRVIVFGIFFMVTRYWTCDSPMRSSWSFYRKNPEVSSCRRVVLYMLHFCLL